MSYGTTKRDTKVPPRPDQPIRSMVPAVVDAEGNVTIPVEFVPTLTAKQSKAAYGTKIHALRALEMLMLSGRMNMKEIMHVLEVLAKYQFQPAAQRPTSKDEKTVEDWLTELGDELSE